MKLKIQPVRAASVVLATTLAVFASAPCASAGIISTTGAAKVVNFAPQDITQNKWESSSRVRVFEENVDISLKGNLSVDFVNPGVYKNSPQLNQGIVEGGLLFNSYLLHMDGKGDKLRRLAGSILFDQDILGIIVNKNRLINSDGAAGLFDQIYENTPGFGRGLELRRGHDLIRISNSRRRLTFSLLNSDGIDEVRIITRAVSVPTPGSLALLGMAGLTLVGRRRRA
jgi:hypothetical protein